ncbi:hypothetical protein FHG87_003269 [Trinorchestia longiramus]|nr:hypothetical protein FHG87_003269 [Trinorchestia longiramus]
MSLSSIFKKRLNQRRFGSAQILVDSVTTVQTFTNPSTKTTSTPHTTTVPCCPATSQATTTTSYTNCPATDAVTPLAIVLVILVLALCALLVYIKILRNKVQSLEAIEEAPVFRDPRTHLPTPDVNPTHLNELDDAQESSHCVLPTSLGGPPVYLEFPNKQTSQFSDNNASNANHQRNQPRAELGLNNQGDHLHNDEYSNYINVTKYTSPV